ncbi:MAG: TRAP transporter small permease subunit, partial [Thauera sp.]|nr:TRAP transporter small permease subunit [Thauera sp.]
LFAFIAFYAGKLTWDQYRFEETSPALGVPQWWYTVWMPVLAVALVLRLVITRLRRQSPPPGGNARGDARAAQ